MYTVSRRSFLKQGALGLTVVSGSLAGLGWLGRLAVAAPNDNDTPEMTNHEYVEHHLLEEGLHCSQTVVKRYAEKRGWNKEELMAAAVMVGGAMGPAAPCGGVTGALMVLGLHAHSITDGVGAGQGQTMRMHAEFSQQFLQEYETLICSELLGLDLMTPEGWAAYMEQGLGYSVCVPMIAGTLDILDRMMAAEESV